MGWTAPSTFNPGQVVGASDLNAQIRDNMSYLLSQRPGGTPIRRDNNAAYTTTSTAFVDVDSTNLLITMTTNGSVVLVTFAATVANSTAAEIYFDITVDGTRYGSSGADGIWVAKNQAGYVFPVSGSIIVTGLAAGLHTFKLQWKVGAGTGSLYSGLAPMDTITCFGAREIG